jgi:hypothetical protein
VVDPGIGLEDYQGAERPRVAAVDRAVSVRDGEAVGGAVRRVGAAGQCADQRLAAAGLVSRTAGGVGQAYAVAVPGAARGIVDSSQVRALKGGSDRALAG